MIFVVSQRFEIMKPRFSFRIKRNSIISVPHFSVLCFFVSVKNLRGSRVSRITPLFEDVLTSTFFIVVSFSGILSSRR